MHFGWLSERETVGELCLVSAHSRRPVTVVSGENGAELIMLERSAFNHLSDRAQHDVSQPQHRVYFQGPRIGRHAL